MSIGFVTSQDPTNYYVWIQGNRELKFPKRSDKTFELGDMIRYNGTNNDPKLEQDISKLEKNVRQLKVMHTNNGSGWKAECYLTFAPQDFPEFLKIKRIFNCSAVGYDSENFFYVIHGKGAVEVGAVYRAWITRLPRIYDVKYPQLSTIFCTLCKSLQRIDDNQVLVRNILTRVPWAGKKNFGAVDGQEGSSGNGSSQSSLDQQQQRKTEPNAIAGSSNFDMAVVMNMQQKEVRERPETLATRTSATSKSAAPPNKRVAPTRASLFDLTDDDDDDAVEETEILRRAADGLNNGNCSKTTSRRIPRFSPDREEQLSSSPELAAAAANGVGGHGGFELISSINSEKKGANNITGSPAAAPAVRRIHQIDVPGPSVSVPIADSAPPPTMPYIHKFVLDDAKKQFLPSRYGVPEGWIGHKQISDTEFADVLGVCVGHTDEFVRSSREVTNLRMSYSLLSTWFGLARQRSHLPLGVWVRARLRRRKREGGGYVVLRSEKIRPPMLTRVVPVGAPGRELISAEVDSERGETVILCANLFYNRLGPYEAEVTFINPILSAVADPDRLVPHGSLLPETGVMAELGLSWGSAAKTNYVWKVLRYQGERADQIELLASVYHHELGKTCDDWQSTDIEKIYEAEADDFSDKSSVQNVITDDRHSSNKRGMLRRETSGFCSRSTSPDSNNSNSRRRIRPAEESASGNFGQHQLQQEQQSSMAGQPTLHRMHQQQQQHCPTYYPDNGPDPEDDVWPAQSQLTTMAAHHHHPPHPARDAVNSASADFRNDNADEDDYSSAAMESEEYGDHDDDELVDGDNVGAEQREEDGPMANILQQQDERTLAERRRKQIIEELGNYRLAPGEEKKNLRLNGIVVEKTLHYAVVYSERVGLAIAIASKFQSLQQFDSLCAIGNWLCASFGKVQLPYLALDYMCFGRVISKRQENVRSRVTEDERLQLLVNCDFSVLHLSRRPENDLLTLSSPVGSVLVPKKFIRENALFETVVNVWVTYRLSLNGPPHWEILANEPIVSNTDIVGQESKLEEEEDTSSQNNINNLMGMSAAEFNELFRNVKLADNKDGEEHPQAGSSSAALNRPTQTADEMLMMDYLLDESSDATGSLIEIDADGDSGPFSIAVLGMGIANDFDFGHSNLAADEQIMISADTGLGVAPAERHIPAPKLDFFCGLEVQQENQQTMLFGGMDNEENIINNNNNDINNGMNGTALVVDSLANCCAAGGGRRKNPPPVLPSLDLDFSIQDYAKKLFGGR